MSQPVLVAIDLVAVIILGFGLYFPRYRRKDIVVAIVGLNVGVMSVAIALSSTDVSTGFGFGLFAVLSIIRLRSSELAQEEVAYYFAALAIGLLAGVNASPDWVTPVMAGAILGALFISDHPRVFADSRSQIITLDAAYTNEAELVDRLESTLNANVQKMKVLKTDLVNDTTMVDVRFRLNRADAANSR